MIREVLAHGNETEKKSLVEALRLLLPPYARVGGRQRRCMEYTSAAGGDVTIDLHEVVLKAPGPQTVMVARPQDCEYIFVVVLEPITPGGWVHHGTVPILAKHWEPEISFHCLVTAGEHEIVVRNRPTDIGTGTLQRNVTIFKLVEGTLRVIFDEVERQAFAIPTTRNGQPANTDQSQESRFWFVDAQPGSAGLKEIVEKQVIRDQEAKVVRWWIFDWLPELRIFEKVATDGNPGEGKKGTIELDKTSP